MRAITSNTGEEPSLVIAEEPDGKATLAATPQLTSMAAGASGVVNPTKVTRIALQNAASVACRIPMIDGQGGLRHCFARMRRRALMGQRTRAGIEQPGSGRGERRSPTSRAGSLTEVRRGTGSAPTGSSSLRRNLSHAFNQEPMPVLRGSQPLG
jgi:hypothetical protein